MHGRLLFVSIFERIAGASVVSYHLSALMTNEKNDGYEYSGRLINKIAIGLLFFEIQNGNKKNIFRG